MMLIKIKLLQGKELKVIFMCRCGGASEHGHIQVVTEEKNLHSFIRFEDCTGVPSEINIKSIIRERYKTDSASAVALKSLEIAFSEPLKLKSFVVEALEGSPLSLTANPKSEDSPPTQTFQLTAGLLEYPVRIVSFTKLKRLRVEFKEVTRISYLGLIGEVQNEVAKPVNATYELKPQLSDHPSLQNLTHHHSRLGM